MAIKNNDQKLIMSFSLYQLCITYWLACIVVICILGIFTLRKVRKSETIMGLVYFGKFRKDHNFKTWLRIIEMPKRLFWIFYLIASIAVLFALIDIVINSKLQYNDNLIFNLMGLLLYLTHVIRRLYECLYVSIFSDSSMNILHFLLGITFYPFCVCSQLASFTLLNNKTALLIAIFIVQIKQHHCFVLLAQLRLNSGVNANTYTMPNGGLFEHCLSPHYLLEIILYFLFALIYHLSTPMLLCFLFVTINQTIAALLNQNWKKIFADIVRLYFEQN
ncbi:3-oxo-5-alpha-steroid 4-dehydrogenase family protein [Brugia pahangi]